MTAPNHVDACDGFNACTLLRDAVRVSERGVADVECDLCASCRKLPGQAAKAGRSEIVVHIEAVPGGGVSRDGREEEGALEPSTLLGTNDVPKQPTRAARYSGANRQP